MRAPTIATIVVVCLGFTAGAALLTARGQYSRPGEIGANHVTVDNRVEVTGTVAIDPAKAVGVRAVRQAWEYRTLTVGAGKDAAGALAAAGLEGWEAVGIQGGAAGTTVLLKRPR
jgi:hypothetical protein